MPTYAHHLITLLLGSQVKHEIIYTRGNRKRVDEWIQSTIKFYLHEFKKRKKRSRAMVSLQRNESEIRKVIEMILSFENILVPKKKNDDDASARPFLDFLTQVYNDVRASV